MNSEVNMAAAPSSLSQRALDVGPQLGRTVLFALFTFMFVAVLYPELRTSIRGAVVPDFRSITSTARGDLAGNGTEFTVAKVRTQAAFYLEIYEAQVDGSQRLVERIELSDKKDGYFNFNGQATNLAIDDIDGDGAKEILVPSFDHNLIGHLNIYRFDPSMGGFQRSML
jgi:hypothetical protein